MSDFSIRYALLSMQRALLGEVTPELRAVVVDVLEKESLLYIRFYYDGPVSEELMNLWDCVITETTADFGPDVVFDYAIERLDYPQKIPERGRYAYLRNEENVCSSQCDSVAEEKTCD
jgi:hypothetical protein